MRKRKNMKNVVLSLVGLLMFVGCGNNIINPNDDHHISWYLVDPEADEVWVCEDEPFTIQTSGDLPDLPMPNCPMYFYSEEDCRTYGCENCYGGHN